MCQSIDDVLFVGIGWIFFWYFLLGLQTGSKVLLFRETYPFPKKWQKNRFYLLVPRGTREKGPIKWTLSVCPSVLLSVRSLPRYLQISWMDFFEIFRKVQSYANLERDIFGFLKKIIFGRILGKKNEPKTRLFVLFSSDFWKYVCMFWVFMAKQKFRLKWAKTSPKAGHWNFFEKFSTNSYFLQFLKIHVFVNKKLVYKKLVLEAPKS